MASHPLGTTAAAVAALNAMQTPELFSPITHRRSFSDHTKDAAAEHAASSRTSQLGAVRATTARATPRHDGALLLAPFLYYRSVRCAA
jgi:hypothetical protein